MTIAGAVTFSLFWLFVYLSPTYDSTHLYFEWHALISFLVGLSLAGVYFFNTDESFLSDIRSIPFFGFKLSLITIVILVATGIPIVYYLYQLFVFGIGLVRKDKAI